MSLRRLASFVKSCLTPADRPPLGVNQGARRFLLNERGSVAIYFGLSAIVFVGFAASGSLARQIIDGASRVRLFGEEIPVRAAIHTINGFSAHADQRELLAWRNRIGGCETTFLVHGEEPAMKRLAGHLPNCRVEMPGPGEVFDL